MSNLWGKTLNKIYTFVCCIREIQSTFILIRFPPTEAAKSDFDDEGGGGHAKSDFTC